MLCDLSLALTKSSVVFPVLTACKDDPIAASDWLARAVPSVIQLLLTSIPALPRPYSGFREVKLRFKARQLPTFALTVHGFQFATIFLHTGLDYNSHLNGVFKRTAYLDFAL